MSGGLQTGVGKPPMVSISLLGDPGSGKTSIKKHLLGKKFDENERITIGAQYSFINLPQFDGLKLKIADIAGQITFDVVRQQFLAGSDAALLVFDLTNPRSLSNIHGWLKNYLKANSKKSKVPPVLLVGNKLDLERKVHLSNVKEFLKLAEEDYQLNDVTIDYIETSAKTGENIAESFTNITSKLVP